MPVPPHSEPTRPDDSQTPGEWLRDRLARGPALIAPGAFDAVSAMLIARHGFEAAYCGGYATVASAHGLPDLGLAGMGEMVAIYRRLAAATSARLIVDVDTGYGGPLNVARLVGQLSRIGVAGLQIEDQVNPKRCGHLERKEVVPVEEAVARVIAAVDAAGDTGPAVIARVDAIEPEGLEAALERGNRYLEAGADAVLVDAPRSREEIERIREGLPGPLVFNAARTQRGPVLSVAELDRLGYTLVVFPIELLYASHGAMTAVLERLRGSGELDEDVPPRPTFDEFNDFLELPQFLELERRYAAAIGVSPVAPPSRTPGTAAENHDGGKPS